MVRRWVLPHADPAQVDALAKVLPVGTAAAKVLIRRGFSAPDDARRFLHPSLDELLDPLLMRDMPAALDRLERAIRGKEKILIYGDYDVDGTSSVVVLTK